MFRIFLFLSCLIIASPAYAEVQTWTCDLGKRVDEQGVGEEKFHIVFKIDTITGKAFMQGNVGLADVELYVGQDAFLLFQQAEDGEIMVTSITTILRDGRAVHSRNTIIAGEIVAAQHFGRCLLGGA